MKVITGIMVALLIVLCVGGIAVGAGLTFLNRAATSAGVQALPPLQPLAAQATENDDVVVTVSERYLNRQLSQNLPQDGQVSNVFLDLHAGNLANVSATVQVNSMLRLQPNATVLLSVSNGRIQITVQKIEVGGFGVPSSFVEPQITELETNAETQLNQQLAELEKSAGLRLTTLSTTENSLTLHFAP